MTNTNENSNVVEETKADVTEQNTQEQSEATEESAEQNQGDAENATSAEHGDEEVAEEKDEASEEEFLPTLPEGTLIEDAGEFKQMLVDAATNQEGFDKLLEFVQSKSEAALEEQAKAEEVKWKNTVSAWEDSLKKDESFGTDYQGNVKVALEAADKIGLGEWLRDTGFDKNPNVLKAMLKVAKDSADAELVTGKAAATTKHRDGFEFPSLDDK